MNYSIKINGPEFYLINVWIVMMRTQSQNVNFYVIQGQFWFIPIHIFL